MTPVLDRLLCERFPKLYADRGSMRSGMCWGFSCGEGWFSLLFDLSEEITGILNEMDANFPQATKTTREPRTPLAEVFRVVQVKEKFGTLRYYTNSSIRSIDAAIRKAETRSAETCEECGAPGVLRGTTWVRTTCVKHAQGALPHGCAVTKTACSRDTQGCIVDHAAEAAETAEEKS
jgi:hypothetical protein